VDVLAYAGAVARPLAPSVETRTTLARGKLRAPYRLLGQLRALAVHDRIVARRLPSLAERIDLVHAWPSGALETLRVASRLGIPTVLERPNAHTRFAYEVVARECERLGIELPPDHEHAYNESALAREEEEYRLADRLLCPSEFVVKTFLDEGFPRERLVRHIYGFDDQVFRPAGSRDPSRPFTMISVGVAAVRKGLHFALEAWLRSPAHEHGRFLVVGEMLPAYGEKLAPMLAHPSVEVLGHRDDVPELMRESDVLVLPSIEEGFGLVCVEAFGSGCVPLVSDACTDLCRHMDNALVHRVGDVDELTRQITAVYENRELLARLRESGTRFAPECTWRAAGVVLRDTYVEVVGPGAAGRDMQSVAAGR
jgi:glycosyltransferase involved in cell wall biosynthesis